MMSIDSNLAIVFPGQGAQSVGMMAGLGALDPIIQTTFAEASENLGYDLWKLVNEGPETELNSTEITQPALLAAGVATWRLWKSRSNQLPALLAGHSLGEYTALVCADVIHFDDAINLVAERGRRMQAAVPAGVGAMAAILGLEDEQVESVCQQAAQNEIVTPANFNSPGQIVIAGDAAAVARAMIVAKEAGAKRVLPLPVSVPSHCMLMKSAADEFAEHLNKVKFSDAVIPIVQNVDAVVRSQAEALRPALLEQLYRPVQWVNVIRTMKSMNITKIMECGPGKVLVGLVKRTDREMDVQFVQDEKSLGQALA